MQTEREAVIYTVGNLYKVRWAGGGEVPQALNGSYTSQKVAKWNIDRYLESRRPKPTGKKKDA